LTNELDITATTGNHQIQCSKPQQNRKAKSQNNVVRKTCGFLVVAAIDIRYDMGVSQNPGTPKCSPHAMAVEIRRNLGRLGP
jgi:hypothetical protein